MAMSFEVDEDAVAEAYASKWWLFLISGIWSIFKGAADLIASFSYRSMKKELAAA